MLRLTSVLSQLLLTSRSRRIITGTMNLNRGSWLPAILLVLFPALLRAETFRVAEYNVENYLDQPTETRRYPKSSEAKAKIRESIHALRPDVISFEEMGTTNALLELRASLK